MSGFTVQFRKKVIVSTDTQRRCYDGCHFSSEEQWTTWEDICAYRSRGDAEDSAKVFKDINQSREYRVLENA